MRTLKSNCCNIESILRHNKKTMKIAYDAKIAVPRHQYTLYLHVQIVVAKLRIDIQSHAKENTFNIIQHVHNSYGDVTVL